MVPTSEFPPAIPLTLQFTALLLLPLTVAVKFDALPSSTDALAGEIFTVMFDGVELLLTYPPQAASASGKKNAFSQRRGILFALRISRFRLRRSMVARATESLAAQSESTNCARAAHRSFRRARAGISATRVVSRVAIQLNSLGMRRRGGTRRRRLCLCVRPRDLSRRCAFRAETEHGGSRFGNDLIRLTASPVGQIMCIWPSLNLRLCGG